MHIVGAGFLPHRFCGELTRMGISSSMAAHSSRNPIRSDRDMLTLDNRFARELEGLHVPWQGRVFPAPRMLRFNHDLARALGLPDGLDTPEGAAFLSGSRLPETLTPVAQAYAGHQFGHFVPQLGDGRALLLGELVDSGGVRRDLHLKGSGPTPFSRGGDGKAAVGPMLREFLIGEAMHALGIPTTRALAVVATGEWIQREGPRPGAVLARVALSHLRVGTFEYAATHLGPGGVKRLADHAIARHDPDLQGHETPYLTFLERVIERQVQLVVQWMLVGFVHGVMNTDNTTISGESIDYGPCAFMEAYDPGTVFSSIDVHGRYAYGNQPGILEWNLARFAETLLPLIEADSPEHAVALATERIHAIPSRYRVLWLDGMRCKLGLASREEEDLELVEALLGHLQHERVDFTQAFRALCDAAEGRIAPFRRLFDPASPIDVWLARWQARLARDSQSQEERRASMQRANPIYIPRNHKVEEALAAAERENDFSEFDRLLEAVRQPFDARPGLEDLAQPAPEDFGPYRTFCGT